MRVAIDFGASNTDAVARSIDGTLHQWTIASIGRPNAQRVHSVLAAAGIAMSDVSAIAVTGGDRSELPELLDGIALQSVAEVAAIGRGGLAMAGLEAAAVVSAGSGTAVIAARPDQYSHISGTGVGGGTLLGLARLLIGTAEPQIIDALARAGNHASVNLTIGDVVGEAAIGSLPADTTAVNFGKLARQAIIPSRPDMAAAIVNLVGQVIAVVAINAARSQQFEDIVVIGHLADLRSVHATIAQVGGFYGAHIHIPERGGYATALGALESIETMKR
jgi:type II pantothenate kinase